MPFSAGLPSLPEKQKFLDKSLPVPISLKLSIAMIILSSYQKCAAGVEFKKY